MTPVLSVVIPVCNMQDTILKSVCSALRQANVDLEVVVLDDGSTDRTRAVVEALQNPHVRIISQPNGGMVAALNAGVEHAHGRYCYCIGADDWLEPDSVQYAVSVLDNQQGVGFVYGSVLYHGDGMWRYDPPPFTEDYFNHHYSAISGYIFRRCAWETGCRWRNDTIADWDHVLQLVNAGYSGQTVPLLMFHYWWRQNSGYLADIKANKGRVLDQLKRDWPAVTAVDF